MDQILDALERDLGTARNLTSTQLADILERADKNYHVHGHPIVSDDVYDYIKDVLQKIDPSNPALKKVGHPSGKVVLPKYMGSMDKIKGNEKELSRWCGKFPGPYVITNKLDGISALLCNEPGGTRLLTRGNGTLGEDASFMLQYCKGVPDRIPKAIEYVRGELIMPLSEFSKAHGKNPRNVVAGLVNSKRSRKEDLMRKVVFIAYELVAPMAPSQQFKTLKQAGFSVVTHTNAQQLSTQSLSSELERQRDASSFEIDGLVVVDDNVHARLNGKNPDYAFAYKTMASSQETADVIVEKVTWEVSKDNFLIPTVVYEPVELDGVTMQKATGFNAKFIVDSGIGPGARIVVVRSGQVIPYIVSVTTPAKPQLPTEDYKWNESGIHVVAVRDSRERQIRANTYFFKTIGVKGVSDKTVEHMYDNGFTTISDIINVNQRDLMLMDGFQERSAMNVVSSIKTALDNATCLQIMSASNAFGRGFAEKKLALVASSFPDWDSITMEKLLAVDGIGEVLAHQFMQNIVSFKKFLQETGIKCKFARPPAATQPNKLAHVVAVFTNFRDAALEAFLRAHGGRVVAGVSKVTTVVVNGNPDKESTKVKEAESKQIPVLTVGEFKKLVSFSE